MWYVTSIDAYTVLKRMQLNNLCDNAGFFGLVGSSDGKLLKFNLQSGLYRGCFPPPPHAHAGDWGGIKGKHVLFVCSTVCFAMHAHWMSCFVCLCGICSSQLLSLAASRSGVCRMLVEMYCLYVKVVMERAARNALL